MRRDGRDLVAEWQAAAGRAYVWSRAQLDAIDPAATRQLLGLFEPSHMRFETERAADRAGEPSLAEMTTAAIRVLSRDPDGFVLLVEGGRIDHAHHLGSAWRALTETIALSDAVRAALASVDLAETLVVVTADHDHTLAFGGYPTRGNPILGTVVANDSRGVPAGPARDAAGRPYTALSYANGPGHLAATNLQPAGPKRYPHAA
jgi:alkaline phosphatase